jgi:hypothetical protein
MSAASSAPAWCLACAAASARPARRAGSSVSAAARSRNAAAAASPPRACARPAERYQLGGDVRVEPGRRLGEMPGAAIGIDLRIGGGCQRAVDITPVLRRRVPIDRRAH